MSRVCVCGGFVCVPYVPRNSMDLSLGFTGVL